MGPRSFDGGKISQYNAGHTRVDFGEFCLPMRRRGSANIPIYLAQGFRHGAGPWETGGSGRNALLAPRPAGRRAGGGNGRLGIKSLTPCQRDDDKNQKGKHILFAKFKKGITIKKRKAN